MGFIKKLFYHTTGILFKVTLVLLPLVFAITQIVSSTSSVERALQNSGVYDNFVLIVLDNSAKQAKSPQEKLLLSDPEVRAVIQKSFPPETLEASATSVVKGVFGWLQGNTTEPEFTIDLSGTKERLTANLTAFADKRIRSLPVCTQQQLQTINPQGDLLSLPCQPPGVDIAQLSSQFSNDLLANVDFLDKPTITNETLSKESDKSVTADLEQVPKTYQAAQASKWILLGVSLVLACLLVFVRRDKQAGISYVAWSFIGAAAFWLIAIIINWFVINRAGSSINDAAQTIALNGTKSLANDAAVIIGLFVIGYAVTGIGTILIMHPRSSRTDKLSKPAARTQ